MSDNKWPLSRAHAHETRALLGMAYVCLSGAQDRVQFVVKGTRGSPLSVVGKSCRVRNRFSGFVG